MMYLFLLLSISVFAGQPSHWSHLLEISDRHEFYKENEPILKPKDSWQTLFGLVYIDQNLQRLKDCVFFRVPGSEYGSLKLKTISASESCDGFLLQNGDKEFSEIKSFQFSITKKALELDFNFADFRTEKWTGSFQIPFQTPAPEMNLSSAEFKGPKILFLAPVTISTPVTKKTFPKKDFLCHDVNEDCQEASPPTCHDCENGWYEIPNGCQQSPKYCGLHECGKKDQPACRRGVVWQRREVPLECRLDSSFAYCSNGLTVQCEGKKAFCR